MDVQHCYNLGRRLMTRQARMLMLCVSGFATLAALPAQALSMSECSAKYKAAQTAGSLNGQKWNDFRKAECSTSAAATPAAAPAQTAAEPKPSAAKPAGTKSSESKSATTTPPAASGPAN